ncbi:AAA family ATPase [Kribbella qitaiheensis]|uniref:AAA family ATPase n=1 Tax=Kribbella qitaiheensis TaxID=1544730 RepID=UPI00360B9C3C
MKATMIEQDRFQPTVFGAVRRYRLMVLVIALLMATGAVAYTVVEPELYRANATVTVPQTTQAQGEDRSQYFDSQVLLLKSPEVADRASRIANAALNANVLTPQDFAGESKALEITPPEGAQPGAFGSSIVAIAFTWPDARVAQVGTNAVLQAFDDARVAVITAQAEATVAGIERAIRDPRTRGQLMDLVNQRTQTLSNLEVDRANHPTFGSAVEPLVAVNGNAKRSGAIGLMVGTLLAAGLAYARASRRRCLEDRDDPAAIYDAPLIGEIPSSGPDGFLSAVGQAGPLPVAADPQSPAAEAFRFAAGSVERIRAARGDRLAVVFVSSESGGERSTVVANVALAVAESGTPVLVVDADSSEGVLTALLLPGSPQSDGFDQVIAGQRPVRDCIETSPLNENVTVLRAGRMSGERTTGTAYAKAVKEIIAEAKLSFDLVLIDSPPLLQVADATDLVDDSDATIVVLGAEESLQDHLTMVERLDQVESDVVGYVYRRASRGPLFVRRLRGRIATRVARRTGLPQVPSAPLYTYRRRNSLRPPVRRPQG